MSIKTLSVNAKGMVALNCPFCGDGSMKQANSLPNGNQPTGISVSCSSCGKTYVIQIDFRQFFRKQTSFDGFYSNWSSRPFRKDDRCRSFPRWLRFHYLRGHSLSPDDRIKLVFNLDDAKHTRVEKDAAVRAVKGTHQIGCEFAPTASGYDPDIGFYLRPIWR